MLYSGRIRLCWRSTESSPRPLSRIIRSANSDPVGLLDADACAAKLDALDAQLTQLRAKRRKLLRNDDISEMADALRQTVETLHQGSEQLDEFDEELFNEMVEKITVDTDHVLRFHLRGGFDVAESLWREMK